MFDRYDRGLIQSAVDSLIAKVRDVGCSVEIEPDFNKLKSFMTERNTFVNPTYDPNFSNLTDRDFWVHVRDPQGRSIAASAERVLETDDFMDLLATGQLFYRGGYADVCDQDSIDVIRPMTRLSGTVSHSGSTWVDRDWRGQGWALIMPYLSRALSFRNFDCSANTGFVRRNLYQSPVPIEVYGYAHVSQCLNGFFPPQNGHEELFLCWVSAQDFITKLEALPNHPRYPVEIPALQQRDGELAVAAE